MAIPSPDDKHMSYDNIQATNAELARIWGDHGKVLTPDYRPLPKVDKLPPMNFVGDTYWRAALRWLEFGVQINGDANRNHVCYITAAALEKHCDAGRQNEAMVQTRANEGLVLRWRKIHEIVYRKMKASDFLDGEIVIDVWDFE